MNKTKATVFLLCTVGVFLSTGCPDKHSVTTPPTTLTSNAALFIEWTWDFSQQTSLGALLGLTLSGNAIVDTPGPKMVPCFGLPRFPGAGAAVPCYPSGLVTTSKLLTPGPKWSGSLQIDNAQPGLWTVSATALNGNQTSSPQADGIVCNVTVQPNQRAQLTLMVGVGRGCSQQ